MKIALMGATGRVGPCILRELNRRSHQVTALSRHKDQIEDLPGVTAHRADANKPTTYQDLIADHDIVVSSIQFGKVNPDLIISTVAASAPERYMVVGGSGTLLVPQTQTRIMDTPQFPADFKNFAASAARFFDRLQQEENLAWTFLSPPPGIGPGPRTGKFRLGKDEVLMRDGAFSTISFEDYAIAFVDEIESPQHIGQRFTVGY